MGGTAKYRPCPHISKAFDKAIELKPDYAAAWYGKACIYSLEGDKRNAPQNLSKAIELDAKYKEYAKEEEHFENLLDDEDFKRITKQGHDLSCPKVTDL